MKKLIIAILFISLLSCNKNKTDPSAIGDEAFSILQKLDSENSEIIKNHIPDLQDFRKQVRMKIFNNEVDKTLSILFLRKLEAFSNQQVRPNDISQKELIIKYLGMQ